METLLFQDSPSGKLIRVKEILQVLDGDTPEWIQLRQ